MHSWGNGLVLIQGAADGKPGFVQDVRVNHGGGEVAMAEERGAGSGLDPSHDRERHLFHEYFNGDTGGGLGASIRPDGLGWSRS